MDTGTCKKELFPFYTFCVYITFVQWENQIPYCLTIDRRLPMRYLPNGTMMGNADSYTIHTLGVPSIVLMEHAAIHMVHAIEERAVDLSHVLIVCGSGNNGGDGFAVARLLHNNGIDVTVCFAGKVSSMSEECRIQANAVKNIGIPIVTTISDRSYTVVIDAIFGVGLNRDIAGNYFELIERLNQIDAYKVAVDIPSGIHSETGRVLGTAFCADLTVTFQCEKLGTVFFPGKTYAGEVEIADIGISLLCMDDSTDVCYTLEPKDISSCLPVRTENSHKGSYGKVLMVTGSDGMAGAAYLSAKAAYICGAGLVQIYTPESNRMILQQLLPEAIISTYTEFEPTKLQALLDWSDVVCIGCGLGQSAVSHDILMYVLGHGEQPCVVDADGINLLSKCTEILEHTEHPIILTPHLKEMSRLTGKSVAEITADRMQLLIDVSNRWNAVFALKDARTIVSAKGHRHFVNTAGNQSMAKAGSGDVLAGTITGLLAGHLDPYMATVSGVYLHASGGDLAKKEYGSYSVLAENLIEQIGICMKEAEERK